MSPNYADLARRFMAKTHIVDGHWLWMGARNQTTRHGLATINGKVRYLHRYMFCLKNKLDYDIKFFICHKQECNIPYCWNPDHLYIGDAFSNMRDLAETKSRQTHCLRGHEYTSENTRTFSGKRHCLICRRIADRNRRARTA